MRERGEVVGLLYASEYPIYGRYGYGPACRVATWTLDTIAGPGSTGIPCRRVELVTPDQAAADMMNAVFEAWRARQAGEIRRRDFRWQSTCSASGRIPWGRRGRGSSSSTATPRHAGRLRPLPCGGEVRRRSCPRARSMVDELARPHRQAHAALWRYLGESTSSPPSRPRAGARRTACRGCSRTLRAANLRDVWRRHVGPAARRPPRAGRADVRAGGERVLEVVDPAPGAGPGRPRRHARRRDLLSQPTAHPTSRSRSPRSGAAYLGGTRLRDAMLATGVDEHRSGRPGPADALLRTADEPISSTHF